MPCGPWNTQPHPGTGHRSRRAVETFSGARGVRVRARRGSSSPPSSSSEPAPVAPVASEGFASPPKVASPAAADAARRARRAARPASASGRTIHSPRRFSCVTVTCLLSPLSTLSTWPQPGTPHRNRPSERRTCTTSGTGCDAAAPRPPPRPRPRPRPPRTAGRASPSETAPSSEEDVSDPPARRSSAASRAYGRAPEGSVAGASRRPKDAAAGETGHRPPCAASRTPSFLAQTCTTSPSRSTSADETAYPSSLSVTAVASRARPRSATIASASVTCGASPRGGAGGRYHTNRFSGARRSTGIRRASMLRRRRAAHARSGSWSGEADVGTGRGRYP